MMNSPDNPTPAKSEDQGIEIDVVPTPTSQETTQQPFWKRYSLVLAIVALVVCIGLLFSMFQSSQIIKVEEDTLTEEPIEILPSFAPSESPEYPVELTSPSPADTLQTCRVTNCHGLEVECGVSAPIACTMEYAAGDDCRQFVSCQQMEGSCQPVYQEQYYTCKSCVEKCMEAFPNDPEGYFICDSECAEGS